jgi:hypothetical protein
MRLRQCHPWLVSGRHMAPPSRTHPCAAPLAPTA